MVRRRIAVICTRPMLMHTFAKIDMGINVNEL